MGGQPNRPTGQEQFRVSVLAPSVGILWQVIESRGLDPAPLFAAEGIDLKLPVEPGTRLSYHAVDRVRARAVELSGDVDLALRFADYVHPSQLGALGYAWLASATLRSALDRMRRYFRVLNDHGRCLLREANGLLHIDLDLSEGSVNPKARDDGQLAYLVTLMRMNMGPAFDPVQVRFPHATPEDRTAYDALFRCELVFGAESNGMTITLADADAPLANANHLLAQLNEQVVSRRLAQLDHANVVARTRAAITEQLSSGQLTDESVAGALHMTSRTMHRRLRKDGTSFRELLNDVRKDLAEAYIGDRTLTLTEITFLLGFSEPSSFSRAFRRWTGQSPSAARQAG